MRSILLAICLLGGVVSTVCGAEAEDLIFSESSYDFGTIEELGGDVSHTFEFRNETSQPIVIYNVRTTCGCTTPEYLRRPIAAGESSQIKVSFDPRFRPGKFKKDIYIYSTASDVPFVLSIVGTVTPRELSIEERYPYTMGEGCRLGAMYITVQDVKPGELMQSVVEYYNGSKRAAEVEFRKRPSASPSLRTFYYEGLAVGENASLEVGYFFDKEHPLGGEREFLRDTIDIYVNGKRSDKSLFIKGIWYSKSKY